MTPIYKNSFLEPPGCMQVLNIKETLIGFWEKESHVPSVRRKAKYCTDSGSGKSTYCYIPAHQNFPGMCLVSWSKANVIFLPSKSCFFIGLCHVHYVNHSFLSLNCETFLSLYKWKHSHHFPESCIYNHHLFLYSSDLSLSKYMKEWIDEAKLVVCIHIIQ